MMSWQGKAACRGLDVQLFFGADEEQPSEREFREAKAKAVCESCPVRRECLDYAVENSVRYGIWGGLDEDERKLERRRRQRRANAA